MKLKSKLFTSAVVFTMVLSMVAVPASAQTTAELTAQINALLAQIAQLQAQIAGGSVGASTTFTTDLTVGSKGAEVTALQQFLVGKGLLTMPAGVAMGYFGTLTKSALAAYQSANGISPAVGYFGPITRAKVNAAGGSTGSTGGTTGGTTGGSTGITTPGAEGTISATESSAGTVSTVYVGDTQAPVLGIKITATGSDMAVQRMKFKLSATDNSVTSDTKFYNKVFDKVSITDGSNVLASSDLNSSTVTKDGTTYYVSVSGFNSIVPKGSSKTYLIKLDTFATVDSADYSTGDTYTIAVATDGIRAVDGAGIDDYSGTTAIAATPTISAALTESATLSVSLNSSTPKKGDVICTSGSSENECDLLPLLVFDLKAEKDAVTITDMNIGIAKAAAEAATAVASTTVYLYDGSTQLASATINGLDTAIFSDFDYTIAKDVTKTLTVKADIRSANGGRAGFTATASSTGITDENSKGDSVTTSGTATGNEVGVRYIGPEFSLVSKSITTDGVPQTNDSVAGYSTSTLTATFNIKIKAVGGALDFGINQATSSPFVASTTGFSIYDGGVATTTSSSVSTSTSITFPSTCTTSGFTGAKGNTCELAEGSEVTVPVSFSFKGRYASGATYTTSLYAIGIARLNWTNTTTGAKNSTFMSGETDWRTDSVSFP